ncbi:unnamed protein product, partial [Pylaiella littoralis]
AQHVCAAAYPKTTTRAAIRMQRVHPSQRINISAVLTVATLSFPLVVATKNDPQN